MRLSLIFQIGCILVLISTACTPLSQESPVPIMTDSLPTPSLTVMPSPTAPLIPLATVSDLGSQSVIDETEMVYIPAGVYSWGVHQEELEGFWIDKYEVTNTLFKKFMEAGGYQNRDYWSETGWDWLQSQGIAQPLYWEDERFNNPQQPVVGISWYEADAYARWAGKRLPTVTEWQAAAQGTDNRVWPWGNEWDPAKANAGDGSQGAPVDVGSYPAGVSPLGAFDMAGNVWEYTLDWYLLRAGCNDHSFCATLSSSWDVSFSQEQFCNERRTHSFGRYPSSGFRTVKDDNEP